MRNIVILGVLLLVGACSSNLEKPVGIGGERDDLKKSPCACLEIYDFKQGGWL